MACFICGREANPIPRTFDGDGISCNSCGDYIVSGTIFYMDSWKELTPAQRLQALSSAKSHARPGKLPVITSHSYEPR